MTLRAEIATSRMRQVDAEQKLGVASAKLQVWIQVLKQRYSGPDSSVSFSVYQVS